MASDKSASLFGERSFSKFQEFFDKQISADPQAHTCSIGDFVAAWEKAIREKVSDRHTPIATMFRLSAAYELDRCDLHEIGKAIYHHLMFDRFEQITKRPAAFRYFCDYYDIPENDLSQEAFVQAWKDYIKGCEMESDPSDDHAHIYFERSCFLGDALDSDPRGDIHEMLIERGLLPED